MSNSNIVRSVYHDLRTRGLIIGSREIRIKHGMGASCFTVEDGVPYISFGTLANKRTFVHEMGHWIVWNFGLERLRRFKSLFGNPAGKMYDFEVWLCWTLDRFLPRPTGRPSWYSTISGEECFCECFLRLYDYGFDIEAAAEEDEELYIRLKAVMTLLETQVFKRKLARKRRR